MAAPTSRCEICKNPTNTSFPFGNRNYFYCEAHRDQLYEKVTGKKPKTTKPK